LPFGIATEQEGVVEAGGGLAALAVALLVVNLSRPLAAEGKAPRSPGVGVALVAGAVAVSLRSPVGSYVSRRQPRVDKPAS
jgi:hypothetical protein